MQKHCDRKYWEGKDLIRESVSIDRSVWEIAVSVAVLVGRGLEPRSL